MYIYDFYNIQPYNKCGNIFIGKVHYTTIFDELVSAHVYVYLVVFGFLSFDLFGIYYKRRS